MFYCYYCNIISSILVLIPFSYDGEGCFTSFLFHFLFFYISTIFSKNIELDKHLSLHLHAAQAQERIDEVMEDAGGQECNVHFENNPSVLTHIWGHGVPLHRENERAEGIF